MSSYYTKEELEEIGFASVGENVSLSKKASIYGASNIKIGNNVRIDDFCILSGNITIGNYVHISAYTALYGGGTIEIGNYCGCSPRCTLFSATDDFSGEFMISPMVPEELTNVIRGPIKMHDYSQLGANSIVLPNVTINEGAVTGSFTFVNKSLDEWTINVGIPAKTIKPREKNIKQLVKRIGESNEEV